MTALLLLALVSQPSARECYARSVDGCLCIDETALLEMKTKALAYDELVASPPSCDGSNVAAGSSILLLLLEIVRTSWGALSTRLMNDAAFEAGWCHGPWEGYLDPAFCFSPTAPIGERRQRQHLANVRP